MANVACCHVSVLYTLISVLKQCKGLFVIMYQ